MVRRASDRQFSTGSQAEAFRQGGGAAAFRVRPDGSMAPSKAVGTGWGGGVIAESVVANQDKECIVTDETTADKHKKQVVNPARMLRSHMLKQEKLNATAAAAAATGSGDPAQSESPVPINGTSSNGQDPAYSSSSSQPSVSKHTPPASASHSSQPGPTHSTSPHRDRIPMPPPPIPSTSSAGWSRVSADAPRPPVEHGSAWKDYVGGLPSDTVQPIGHWAQGRSELAAKNKFSAPPLRTAGYGTMPLPSMPPSRVQPVKTQQRSSFVGPSKVAEIASRSNAAQAAAAPTSSVEASKGPSSSSTPVAAAATPRTRPAASNETHLSRWATPAPTASTSAPPRPTAQVVEQRTETTAGRPQAKQPALEKAAEVQPSEQMQIHGTASRPLETNAATTVTEAVPPKPAGTTTTQKLAALAKASNQGAPPAQSSAEPASAHSMGPSTRPAASARDAAPTAAVPSPSVASFQLNGAAADFKMPEREPYREPEWAPKPQEHANAKSMEEQMEKLSVSTPLQQKRREESPSSRPNRTPRGSPFLPPADRARLASGGAQRVKKSPEEIEELMARMKLKNEETRKQVQAAEKDRAAYEASQTQRGERSSALQRRIDEEKARLEAERASAAAEEKAKQARTQAIQKSINEERAKTAAAKLAAKSGRAWDVGKGASGAEGVTTPAPATSYPSVEAEAREAKRQAEEARGRGSGPAPQELMGHAISEEEAERIRRRDGVRGDDGGWETVVHHEGSGRAETVVR